MESFPLVVLSGEGGVGKTAVIKDLYAQIQSVSPLFIFKAVEFNVSNINKLFNDYGTFTLSDFINELQNIEEKYVVIDSAEKLSDIEDATALREFLSTLINNNWKIIFTTRHSYLDDLKFQLTQVYRFNFQLLNIPNLEAQDLLESQKSIISSSPIMTGCMNLSKILFILTSICKITKV